MSPDTKESMLATEFELLLSESDAAAEEVGATAEYLVELSAIDQLRIAVEGVAEPVLTFHTRS